MNNEKIILKIKLSNNSSFGILIIFQIKKKLQIPKISNLEKFPKLLICKISHFPICYN